MNKKAVSEVITTILIILIVLAAIVVVWNVVKRAIIEQSEDIQPEIFTINLELSKVQVSQFDTQISVSRGAGKGDITSLKFVFRNAAGESWIYEEKDAAKIPGELETKSYGINFAGNITNVNSVSVVPVFGDKIGMETREEIKEISAPIDAVGWWKLESDLRDYAGGNDGSEGSGSFSNLGGKTALYFNDVAHKVTIPKGDYFSGTSANAISVWVYRAEDSVDYQIFSQYSTIDKPQLFLRSTNHLEWGAGGVGPHIDYESQTGEFTTNKWIHIVITRENSGIVEMYVNSNKKEDNVGNPAESPTYPTDQTKSYIGVRSGGGTPSDPFKGYIKNLMIFDRALTEPEIKQLYNSQ